MDAVGIKLWLQDKFDTLCTRMREIQDASEEKKKYIDEMKQNIARLQEIVNIESDLMQTDNINVNNYNIVLNSIADQMIEYGFKEFGEPLKEELEIKTHEIPRLCHCDKRVIENVSTLEEWSKLQVKDVLYDSESNEKTSVDFRSKVLHHSHMYFIVIDSEDNIFGNYIDTELKKTGQPIADKKAFMFTLSHKGKEQKNKYPIRLSKSNNAFYLFTNKKFYGCGYSFYGGARFAYCLLSFESNKKGEYENNHLYYPQNSFDKASLKDIIGVETEHTNFLPKRLIVIEMK